MEARHRVRAVVVRRTHILFQSARQSYAMSPAHSPCLYSWCRVKSFVVQACERRRVENPRSINRNVGGIEGFKGSPTLLTRLVEQSLSDRARTFYVGLASPGNSGPRAPIWF